MKNSILRFFGAFCLSCLFSLSSFGQSPSPLAANGRLQLINRQLCNEAGTPIQLRGMSSHGLHWFDPCYNASAVQTLATDWGIDVFRAVMYVDEGGYMNNKVGLRNKINQIVDWTAQSGVYCIIDWHILNPGDPNIHTADAVEFFGLMAQQHAGKKHVIYEICNEPNGVNWASVKSYAEQVIPVIRQYDPNAVILVGTPSWSGAPGDVISNPLVGANAYNVMYTFHFYAGSHYTQNYIDNVLQSVPLFVSEWGTSNFTGNGGNDYTNAQNWVNLMAGQNSSGIKVSWCNWSFCDKDESSAALSPGACGSNLWNTTSPSGTWVKDHILNPADNFGPPTPFVSITSPANNASVTVGSNLIINASVGNTTASTVEFYNGTTKLGEDATSPYSWTVNNIQAGTYLLTAKAILAAGGTLTSSAVQVTAAPAPNQPPTVSLTAPINNATMTAPATITIAANAADSDGNIAKVEFYSGSTKLGEDSSAPYSFDWTNVAAGAYTITAKAIDNQNAVTTSGAVTVYVNNPGNPTADIIGPDCVSINETKLFELNVSNLPNANSFSWWCTGSTQSLTPVSGQPYKVNINFGPNFTGGQVCIGVNYSASPWYRQFCKNVTVCTGNPPVNQAPTVSLTSPANNAAFTAPATISMAANAADSDGSVAKVEFFNGSTKLGEALSSPYTFSWTNVAAGTYSITAKATDNLGAVTVSGSVSVTVNAGTPPGGADIVGADCVSPNAVKVYELSAANLANATNLSWWCTGSTQSVSSGQPGFGKATINFGSWFSGGQVCVGVNYSASPWYKQYCKSVTVCAGARLGISEPESLTDGIIFPNPSTEAFTFVADKHVRQLTVNDMIGYSRIRFERLARGEKVTFGEELPIGSYIVVVSYEDKTQKTVKILKVSR
ncbi:MAG: Ig-like domain-containing protein [Spirosomataceae bacterium]